MIPRKFGISCECSRCPGPRPVDRLPDVPQERQLVAVHREVGEQEELVQDDRGEHQQQEALDDAEDAAQDLVDRRVASRRAAPSCTCPG